MSQLFYVDGLRNPPPPLLVGNGMRPLVGEYVNMVIGWFIFEI